MSEKIKTATIGYGFHGRELMTKVIAENPLAQVVGIVDTKPRRRRLARNDGYPAYTSPTKLLAKHPDIQYIAMAVNHPQTVRALNDLAEAATQRGIARQLAVTIEKPIATNLKQGKEAFDILSTVFRWGGVFNRLEYPSFRYALAQIASGAIGEITAINDWIDIWLKPPGLDPWVHLPDTTDPTITRGNPLLNGFHSAEILAFLAGLPQEVKARIFKKGRYPKMEVDDTVEAKAVYPSLIAKYHCEWEPEEFLRLETQVSGTKGTIVFEEWGDVQEIYPRQSIKDTHYENPPDFAGKHHSGNYNFHDAVLGQLCTPEQNPLPHSVDKALDLGLVAQTIVEMTYVSSARGGEAVTPEEVIDGIMPLKKLQAMAALAQLPQLRSV